jgi:hypothetical protein
VRTPSAREVDTLAGSIGDGTAYRPVLGSGPRGPMDGDPSDRTLHGDERTSHHAHEDGGEDR